MQGIANVGLPDDLDVDAETNLDDRRRHGQCRCVLYQQRAVGKPGHLVGVGCS